MSTDPTPASGDQQSNSDVNGAASEQNSAGGADSGQPNLNGDVQTERNDPQQNPTLINFTTTADSSSQNLLTTPQFQQSALQNPSPNFSFDSDSPGALAIAEDDEDIADEPPTTQNAPEQPTEAAQSEQGSEQAPPVGSVDSAASAERDGFEVVRIKDLALAEAGQQQVGSGDEQGTKEESNVEKIETDHADAMPRSPNESPGALQIVDEPMIVETSKEETATNAVLTNTTGGEGPQILSNVFGDANPLIPPQQRPSDEVMQLLNEQSARELQEKLELEQKRQQAAENSKLAANALFSLNAASVASSLAGVEVPAVQTATLTSHADALQTSSALPATSSILSSTPTANGTAKIGGDQGQTPKRREAYRWASNLPIFAMAWSYKRYPNQRLRLACSSIRDGHELLKNTMSIVEFDEEHGELTERTQVFIGAPSTELKFIPTTDASQPDLIASATRELRIYSYHTEQQEIVLEAKLCPNKSYSYAGPLTSVDWNEMDPRIVGGSSIDSTCTIWDIEAQESIATVPPPAFAPEQQRLKYKIQTQLIAHERPVHGMAFSRLGSGRDYFASCSADGSVRLFDLRNLKNSTILYEHPEKHKLNHISWNKTEPAQFVIVADSSNELVICDVRMPCRPLVKYSKHLKPVNSVDWAPHSPTHFCSGSSDHQALIWQLQGVSDEPLLAYRSEGEITRIRWSSTYNNWIGISFSNCLEILRV